MQMRAKLLIGLALFAPLGALAQPPQAFKYQAVARDSSGKILANQKISLRASLSTDSAGSAIYSETQSLTTDQFGLVSTAIGTGTPVTGTFSSVAWGNGPKYLKIEIDPQGGSAFKTVSNNKLLSVPYALFAGSGYKGKAPVSIDTTLTIGLNPGTNPNDLMTWDGNNWVSKPLSLTHAALDSLNLDNRQPSLALNYIIALQGVFPSQNQANEPYLAEIIMFAGNFAPTGWAFCNGQLLPINQYQAVFSLLGTTYGGNGTTNFALPDLRGRVPVGFGQGSGLSNYPLGDTVGTETIH